MAGRRSLTDQEERRLLRIVRRLPPRDRALITTLWQTAFRISEVLSLTVKHVDRNGLVDKIGVPPRHQKGRRGKTRWVPVLPELARALTSYLAWLRRRYELSPDLPLFLSRQNNADGTARAITPNAARHIVHRAFAAAGIRDDGRLGCHTFRKTWGRHVLKNSGNSVSVLQKALHHSSLAVTQAYIEVDESSVEAAIRGCDFTRRPRLRIVPTPEPQPVPFPPAAAEESVHLSLVTSSNQ
jgi:integrase/recombinase XerD